MNATELNEVSAASYASLAAAVTALGSQAATLVITTTLPVSTAVTVPSTLALRFMGGGKLSVTTGGSVTINGPVFAPPTAQIITSSLTTPVSFGLGSVAEVPVEWFGAHGDSTGASGTGTDNTVPIQQAINSVPQFGGLTIRFNGGKYRITGSLTVINNFTNNYQCNIVLKGNNTGRTDTGVASWLSWDGASTTSAMLQLYSMYCRVEGLLFTVCAGRTAAQAIDIDFAPSDGHAGYICTQNVVHACSFLAGNTLGGSTAVLTDGIRIGASGNANCELMRFEQCDFEGFTHAALYIPNGTAQSEFHVMEQCAINNPMGTANYGVYINGGSVNLRDCDISSCVIGVYINNASQPISFTNVISETCKQFLVTNVASWPITFLGGRLASDGIPSTGVNVGSAYIIGQAVTFIGTLFDNGPGAQYMRFQVQSLECLNCGFNAIPNPFGTYPSVSLNNPYAYRVRGAWGTPATSTPPDTWWTNGRNGTTGKGDERGENWANRKVSGSLNPIGGFALAANPLPAPDSSSLSFAGTGGSGGLWFGNGNQVLYCVTAVTAAGEGKAAYQLLVNPLYNNTNLSAAITTTPASSFQVSTLNAAYGTNQGYFQLAAGQTVTIGSGAGADTGLVISSITGTGPYTVNVGANTITHTHTTSDQVMITSGTITLSNLPLGPAGTTSRKIYRENNGIWYLAGTLADNTTTSFTDTGGTTTATPPASDASSFTTGKLGALTLDMLTATTVGAAGAATALPANPVGYLDIEINGAVRKVPFYNP